MPMTRAKFRCASVEQFGTVSEQRTYRFTASYDTSGVPEEQRFSKYTPSADLRMTVDNPGVVFEPGKDYFVDFTPVDEG